MAWLKGIGGQAIYAYCMPFLETPGTKVQIMMTMHVGDSYSFVWLSVSIKFMGSLVIFIYLFFCLPTGSCF